MLDILSRLAKACNQGCIEMKEYSTNDGNGADIRLLPGLGAAPKGRRILHHMVQEVRRHDVVKLRFNLSLLPNSEVNNSKACILSAYYINTSKGMLPPMEKDFRHSERYGHFVYVGVAGDAVSDEFKQEFAVPSHATQLVVTLMPFANPSVRLTGVSMEAGPGE